MKKYIIFIVGAGRSGSTVLDMVLGSHSKGFSLGEIVRLTEWIRNNHQCACREHIYYCQFWRRIKNTVFEKTGINIYRYPEKFPLFFDQENRKNNDGKIKKIYNYSSHSISTPYKWIENTKILFESLFEVTQSNFLVDSSKSITRALWIQRFLRNYNYIYIYIVRHPLHVVRSMMKKKVVFYYNSYPEGYVQRVSPGRPMEKETALSVWIRGNIRTLFYLHLFKKNYLLIRLEDFLCRPRYWIDRILSNMGLNFEEEMLKHTLKKHHTVGGNPSRVSPSPLRIKKSCEPEDIQSTYPIDFNLKYKRRTYFLRKILGYKS